MPYCQENRNVRDPLHHEKVEDLGYRRIIIASDVLEVVKAVNGVEDCSINFFCQRYSIIYLFFGNSSIFLC